MSGNALHLRVVSLVAAFALAAFATTAIADTYDDAVKHPGRSDADLKRDALEKPADVLRLAGIKPGMQVVDVLAAGGYFSELLSYIVGPSGHVILLNNAPYDAFANNSWRQRIDAHHLANVEHRTVDMSNLGLGDNTLDAAVMVKVYHDLYWVSAEDGWPKIDAGAVLDQIVRALKPGGIVLVEDHSAKAGTGNSAAQTLHRIDEEYMRQDFESHGLELVAKSNLLRRPADTREDISFKPPGLGKTDRFVYVFRKPLN